MGNEILDSIGNVSVAFSHYRNLPKEQPVEQVEINYESLLTSIKKVTELAKSYNTAFKVETTFESHKEILESICGLSMRTYKELFPNHEGLANNSKGESILTLIGKQYDENLHSDFIATLLNKEVMGEFAENFFRELVYFSNKGATDDIILSGSLHVYRERRLDSLGNNKGGVDAGDRRIDIFAKKGNSVLAIENKVNSWESDRQTEDYYEAVDRGYAKEIQKYFILLSPSGEQAESKHFVGMSYFELYKLLFSLKKECTNNPKAEFFLKFYINELVETILLPIINSNRKVYKYLTEEKGYGFEQTT